MYLRCLCNLQGEICFQKYQILCCFGSGNMQRGQVFVLILVSLRDSIKYVIYEVV